jgi:hypothetical protein
MNRNARKATQSKRRHGRAGSLCSIRPQAHSNCMVASGQQKIRLNRSRILSSY